MEIEYIKKAIQRLDCDGDLKEVLEFILSKIEDIEALSQGVSDE